MRSEIVVFTAADVERFNRLWVPEPNSGCHLWLGLVSDKGYARFSVYGGTMSGHRFAWFAQHGPLPRGASYHGTVLDHLCRVRSCVNPRHLDPVTQKINIRRGDTGRRKL